jgi:hypothetical protein
MKEKWDACIDCGCVKITYGQRKASRCRSCTVRSPEYRKKMSNSQTEAMNRPEVKAKMSAAQKEVQNRPGHRMKMSVAAKEVQNRPEVRIKQSISHGGDGDLGRIDRERMRMSEYGNSPMGQWTKSVKERDQHTCQHCGETSRKILHAHHVKPKALFPDLALEVDNGLTLCQPCHLSEHRRMKQE